MIRVLLFFITGFLKCRMIPREEGKPYLERYYLGSFRGHYFYLHRFVDRDGDTEMHGHPWRAAWSLVLAGSYIEARARLAGLFRSPWGRYDKVVDLILMPDQHVKRFNRISGDDFHQILSIEGETWTLFWHSQWEQGWGFVEQMSDLPVWGHDKMKVRRFGYKAVKHKAGSTQWWKDKNTRRGWWAGRAPINYNGLI